MIYLASPYSNRYKRVQQRRYEQVMAFVAREFLHGHLLFSPILHCHPMSVSHTLPGDHLFWQHYDEHMIDLSEAVWVLQLPGWEESRGVTSEVNYANKTNKPIRWIEFRG